MTEKFTNNQIFISRLTEIVLGNMMNENFGVKELALEANLSQYSLNRKLYSIKKKKVNQFIREVRLQKAMELLQSEDITATEVSYKVGFGSPVYFNKCFHEFYGFPPGKVRKQNPNNWEPVILTQPGYESEVGKSILRSYLLTFPGILGLFLLLGIAGFLSYRKVLKPEKTNDLVSSDGRISIAVMPFRNMTGDTTLNIWQDGIQECLISFLANNKEMKVRRKENINILLQAGGLTQYASISPDFANKISKKLDANLFVYGSIIKAGSMIRLETQLIGTKTSEVLRSFEISSHYQGEISFDILDSLRTRLVDYLIISKLLKENPLYSSFKLSTNSAEAFRYYLYGDQSFDKGDNSTAITLYLNALAIDSNFFEPMIRLSSVYANQGLNVKNLQWVMKYYNKKDQFPAPQQIAASWAYACNFEPPEECIKYLKQAQYFDDEDPTIPYMLGATYNSIKQYAKSIPELENSLKISKRWNNDFLKNNWAFWLLGEAYNKTGQHGKERKLYREARNYIPGTWLATRQALLAFSEEDTDRANKYIEQYISIKKKDSESEAAINEGLGDIYYQCGLLEKAERYYRTALSQDPGNFGKINTLANFLVDSNRNLKDVSGLMDRAMKLAKDSIAYYNCYDTKARALYKQGLYREALTISQFIYDKAPFKLYAYKSHLDEVKKNLSSQEKH
ncbi:MAG TPA: helix-turn-helix domain-containing protein [Bacteroidales bacterium]|nr:helix-turn-helix domain-containing protein [Bacteroidales bacterium]